MSKVRLSNESLRYYVQSKSNSASQSFQPFVSYVRDDDDTDQENDENSSDGILLTPRLKEHSRKMLSSGEKFSGEAHVRAATVNLKKRFSNNTPTRILQLAQEDKSDEPDDLDASSNSQDENSIRDAKTEPRKEAKLNTKKKDKREKLTNGSDFSEDYETDVYTNQRGRDRPSNLTNDKETVKENKRKAVKSSKTGKNQKKKESSPSPHSDDDAKMHAEPEIAEEQPKPSNRRRGGVRNTAVNVVEKAKTKRGTNPSAHSASEAANPPATLTHPEELSTSKRTSTRKVKEVNNVDEVIENVVASVSSLVEKDQLLESPNIGKKRQRRKPEKPLEIPEKVTAVLNKKTDEKRHSRVRPRKTDFIPIETEVQTLTSSDSSTISSKHTLGNSLRETKLKKASKNIFEDIAEELESDDSLSHQEVQISPSNKATAVNSAEKNTDIDSSSEESEDEDAIFSSRRTARRTANLKNTHHFELTFQTPTKSTKLSLSSAVPSTTKSPSKHQLFNLSDSLPSMHNSPQRSVPTSTGRKTIPEEKITEDPSYQPEKTLQPSPPKSPMKFRSSPIVSSKKTPHRTSVRNPIHRNTPLSSHPKENAEVNSGKSALKRKSTANDTWPISPNKRHRESLRRSESNRVNDSDIESELIQAVEERMAAKDKRKSSAIDSTTLPVPRGIPARFNPYMAPLGDPLRTQLLMMNEEYRLTLLHLKQKSVFTMITYASTIILTIAGAIEIKSDQCPSLIQINPKTRVAEIGAGHHCIITNTGNLTAIFQITESLKEEPA